MPHSPKPETIEVQTAQAVDPAAICSPIRLTVVIEYPNKDVVPGIGRQPCLGGMIAAIQFNDALKELEVMTETLEHLRDRTSCTSTQYEMIDAALDWANKALSNSHEN